MKRRIITQNSSTKTDIHYLPEEVVGNILVSLNHTDNCETLLDCTLVCKQWLKIVTRFELFPNFKQLVIGLGLAADDSFIDCPFYKRLDAWWAYVNLHDTFAQMLYDVPVQIQEYKIRPLGRSSTQVFERFGKWDINQKGLVFALLDGPYRYFYVLEFLMLGDVTVNLYMDKKLYNRVVSRRIQKMNKTTHNIENGTMIVIGIGRVKWHCQDPLEADALFNDLAYYDMNDQEYERFIENPDLINFDQEILW